VADIKDSTVSYVRNYHTPIEHSQKITVDLENMDVKRVTKFWSVILDLCLIAAGKSEAMIIYGDLPIWDVAPGKLIAKEAGVLITGYDGKMDTDKNTFFLATNGTKIHKELLAVLNK
jgi:myo-inositol-1(or 4)-monophosphatase